MRIPVAVGNGIKRQHVANYDLILNYFNAKKKFD